MPECNLSPSKHSRYASLLSPSGANSTTTAPPLRYYIAANLYNSEGVLPTLIHTLTSLIHLLGPTRLHISIYENGSTDTTPAQLYLFSLLLRRLSVGFTIVSDEQSRGGFEHGGRIKGLAEVREKAMMGLKGTGMERVVWLNDVFVCEADVLELLLQHEVQESDMSCGMDYKELRIPAFKDAPEGYPVNFYDVWVARDIAGMPFYDISQTGEWTLPSLPLAHSPSYHSFANHNPFQVFSCFNGLSVLSSSIFLSLSPSPSSSFSSSPTTPSPEESEKNLNLHFRPSHNGQDEESECFLLCSDLWKSTKALRGRGARIQVVPRSAVGYSLGDYERVRMDRDEIIDGENEVVEEEKVEWIEEPPRKVASYPYAAWDQRRWIPPY